MKDYTPRDNPWVYINFLLLKNRVFFLYSSTAAIVTIRVIQPLFLQPFPGYRS